MTATASDLPQETRILVVDDDALMRRTLRTLLESHDHWKVCGEAADGREAVAKVDDEKPVFFIQDAIKFPDLIHAVKMEPDRRFPQSSTAPDTFWDFISLYPRIG